MPRRRQRRHAFRTRVGPRLRVSAPLELPSLGQREKDHSSAGAEHTAGAAGSRDRDAGNALAQGAIMKPRKSRDLRDNAVVEEVRQVRASLWKKSGGKSRASRASSASGPRRTNDACRRRDGQGQIQERAANSATSESAAGLSRND